MTEPIEGLPIEGLPIDVGKVGSCRIRVVTTADGKKHFESDCLDKKARDELTAIFEEEAILRINPKVILEDEPKPDTRLNPTES